VGGANKLGVIARDGTAVEYDLPASSSEPHGATVINDQLWIAMESGSLLRRPL